MPVQKPYFRKKSLMMALFNIGNSSHSGRRPHVVSEKAMGCVALSVLGSDRGCIGCFSQKVKIFFIHIGRKRRIDPEYNKYGRRKKDTLQHERRVNHAY